MEIPLMQFILALFVGLVISSRAYRKKSLDLSGALAGFIVTTIHISLSYRFGAVLLIFFLTSSKLTKYGEQKKRKIDPEFKEGGQRNWIQVVCNSSIATTLLILMAWKLNGSQEKCLDSKESALLTLMLGGIIGHYSCCIGDTWSSELGILSDEPPLLITTFKTVKPGTNGGVTKAGLLAATAGGSVIGLTFVVVGYFTTTCTSNTDLEQLLVIPLSAMAGLLGSIIDSLLGATLQFSGFCNIHNKVVYKPGPSVKKISGLSILDNNAVNFFSVLMTTVLTAFACLYIF